MKHSFALKDRKGNARRGVAATEFAMMLPLLVSLSLTSIDFGRFAYSYIVLGNAGRMAAEVGATHSYSNATAAERQLEMESALREDFSTVGGLDVNQVAVTIDVTTAEHGLNRFTVTATYPFMTAVSWPSIPRPLILQRTISFRRFR